MQNYIKIKTKYLLLLFIISHLSFLISPNLAFAQDSSEPSPTSYDLTHPGLLPDHPLYFLKVARDNVMGFFKGEPLDRASFALLQADKHMAASQVMLSQKQNTELAYMSLETSQHYLEESIRQTASAKKEGIGTEELCQKLKQASQKHLAMFGELKQYVSEKDKKKFEEDRKNAEKLTKMTAAMRP